MCLRQGHQGDQHQRVLILENIAVFHVVLHLPIIDQIQYLVVIGMPLRVAVVELLLKLEHLCCGKAVSGRVDSFLDAGHLGHRLATLPDQQLHFLRQIFLRFALHTHTRNHRHCSD
uniref:(northern house mosquito) hypothetical protein n=1 Tax=Culex pipiens TaxID=7175 RepID=A0A8D8ACZ4_CULPI